MATEENGHVSKRSRFHNGRDDALKIVQKDNGAVTKTDMVATSASDLRQWQQSSSRIFRVSRGSGGKDRHSKVFTSKGLRDRRVRLSVSTAIQFYDLQDRLGYDQPSKAIEWLINAASSAIDELPLLRDSFPELPAADGEQKQVEAAMNAEADPGDHNLQQQKLSMSKSGCSSNSETSKGSVLSLSRSEIRVKKRERAHERTVKDKEGGVGHLARMDNMSQSFMNARSSFTELLTDAASAVCCGRNDTAAAGIATSVSAGAQIQHFPPSTVTADYFRQAGLFTRPAATQKIQTHQLPSSFPSPQAHFLNSSSSVGMVPYNTSSAAAADGYHPEMQQFSFMQGYMDHNLNFSITPGLAGFQRGTLQSNSSAHLTQQHHQHHQQHHMLRFSSNSSSMDGHNMPLVFGAAPPPPLASASTENYLHSEFDSRLQLSREPATPFFLDGYSRQSDIDKGKGKR